jgi:hypothetical protein
MRMMIEDQHSIEKEAGKDITESMEPVKKKSIVEIDFKESIKKGLKAKQSNPRRSTRKK